MSVNDLSTIQTPTTLRFYGISRHWPMSESFSPTTSRNISTRAPKPTSTKRALGVRRYSKQETVWGPQIFAWGLANRSSERQSSWSTTILHKNVVINFTLDDVEQQFAKTLPTK
ncbi:8684_t:CDS:2 [Paraglomus brasilianum]|uniref:8684_t:CDS:1 n=1 Tax=Paraglomus brasilianum TaxID=144538 RepID=A0A9N9B6S8_9GLOM|nr:8684_t:CDS:2 [Paraglomus brasilianum]